ncbi:hypothetical protein BDZ90DRAFT_231756 [Jaminaea rosea]|uniref:Pal1-domain-containing protein n=1 Tax=Jaminaea rosea TaxID=1569628 RepID=A0A316UVP0_9BASI|nr:hypothetical protein BDZ90DRAFT_231756 [Jaminaea rosea]PWN27983.1 hypothetical protein BDZ90DRAFT_231756 [Jaminaea rosea]
MATTQTRRPTHQARSASHNNLLAALDGVIQVTPTKSSQNNASSRAADRSAAFAGATPTSNLDSHPTNHHNDIMSDPLAPPVPTDGKPLPPSKSSGGGGGGGMAGRFANAFRRQTTEEREARRRRQAEEKNKGVGRSKTMNSRMDIIDQLDISGIHGQTMFHHDSPYDACTPHANRSSKKAPVNAFDPNIDQMTGLSISERQQQQQQRAASAGGGSGSRRGLSPLAASTLQKMDLHDEDVKDGARRPDMSGGRSRSATAPLGVVPTLSQTGRNASAMTTSTAGNGVNLNDSATELSSTDGDADADRRYQPSRGYYNQSPKKASNPMADVWGVSSEPWQDFAQPAAASSKPRKASGANSAANGSNGRNGGKGLSPYGHAKSSRDGPPSAASSVLDMESVMTGKTAEQRRREAAEAAGDIGGVSPFPEPDYDRLGGGGSPGGGGSGGEAREGAPKRSKSLVKRIKAARQYGNVPPPDDEVLELSGRRQQAAAAARAHKHSPSSPVFEVGQGNGVRDMSGSGSLGRSGTRKATREEQMRSISFQGQGNGSGSGGSGYGNGGSVTPGSTGSGAGYGYVDAVQVSNTYLSPPEDAADMARGRSSSGGASPTSPGAGGASVGRSGSIFGRFSRKKSSDNRVTS